MSLNKKQLKASPAPKKLRKPQDVIYDPLGQWAHPGEVTKIPSGDITMVGVPYPVLGIDNLGNQIMMQPGQNYQFPGNSVIEYPQLSKAKNGGWLNKYQEGGGKDGKGVRVESQLNGTKAFKDGNSYLTKEEVIKRYGQEWWDEFNPQEAELPQMNLPEVTIPGIYQPSRIVQQKDIVMDNKPKSNFMIIDKGDNYAYYYDKNGENLARENVITGSSNNDRDYGPSMAQWFKDNNTDSHEDYFNYLKENNLQTTPSGIFEISQLRENVAKDPNKLGRWFNNLFRPDKAKEIEDNRTRDYGPRQQLFTLKSEYGVPSSKAIHGTGNEKRISAFNTEGADLNMSNGCINVNGQSICLDQMKKGDNVYVLPEEDPYALLYPRNKNDRRIKNAKTITSTRNKVYQSMIDSGLAPDPESLAFITAVAEKESSGGRSKAMKLEKLLPYSIAHSQGAFQINPETFAKYLPEDYNSDFNSQVKAVYNFYNMEKGNTEASKNPLYTRIDQTAVPAELYQKYAGDTHGAYTPKFKRNFLTALKAYNKGGELPQAGTGRQIDPSIAVAALEDDEIQGHALTPRQRSFFEEVVAAFYGTDPEEDYFQEYRKGGQPGLNLKSGLRRRTTHKNLQSSINELFLRNYLTQGASGKRIYSPLPKKQTGGWLDNY